MAKKLYVQAGKSCTSVKGILGPGAEVFAKYFEPNGCEKGHGEKMLERLYKKEVIGDKDPTAKKEAPKLEKSEAKKADGRQE